MNKDKHMLIIWIVALIVLIVNMGMSIYEFVDYQKRVKSGNDRWEQVEGRIEKLEDLFYGKCNK